MQTACKEDLVYIHDTGFAQFAENAAPMVVDALKRWTPGVEAPDRGRLAFGKR